MLNVKFVPKYFMTDFVLRYILQLYMVFRSINAQFVISNQAQNFMLNSILKEFILDRNFHVESVLTLPKI